MARKKEETNKKVEEKTTKKIADKTTKTSAKTKTKKTAKDRKNNKEITEKNPLAAGRCKRKLDKEQFEKLCGLQCTRNEIIGWFGCAPITLQKWIKDTYGLDTFEEAFNEFSHDGKISLRRIQFQLAEKNATMAIFLGKQYLGQKDQPTMEDDSETLAKLKEIINNTRIEAKKEIPEDKEEESEE